VLEEVEKKYCLNLPRKVISVDYDENVDDLFVRFRYVDKTEGEATEDGRLIIYYDEKDEIAAIEITGTTLH
jgi:uncharacterized protein YuzE